jgi:hypothetical protein
LIQQKEIDKLERELLAAKEDLIVFLESSEVFKKENFILQEETDALKYSLEEVEQENVTLRKKLEQERWLLR